MSALDTLFGDAYGRTERDREVLLSAFRLFHEEESVHAFFCDILDRVNAQDQTPLVMDLGSWFSGYLPLLAELEHEAVARSGTFFLSLDAAIHCNRPDDLAFKLVSEPRRFLHDWREVIPNTARIIDLFETFRLSAYSHTEHNAHAIYGQRETPTPLLLGPRGGFADLFTAQVFDLTLVWRMFGYVPYRTLLEQVAPTTSAFCIVEYRNRDGFEYEIPHRGAVEEVLDELGFEVQAEDVAGENFYSLLAVRHRTT